MCFVDLKKRNYMSTSIDSIRKNKPLRICLLLVLCSAVDGLDAISTPINMRGRDHCSTNSQRWKCKRRTRALYAVRICSSEASLGTPRISWASMIGQKTLREVRDNKNQK
jgi:hypothetical protein